VFLKRSDVMPTFIFFPVPDNPPCILNQTFHEKSVRAVQTALLGLDIGIDTSGKPWIIEANFTPAKSLFLKLKEKSMYHRIMSYK